MMDKLREAAEYAQRSGHPIFNLLLKPKGIEVQAHSHGAVIRNIVDYGIIEMTVDEINPLIETMKTQAKELRRMNND